MSTPKTRVPVAVRHDVKLALECWRDYLVAIDNKNGASAAQDVAFVLGLGELPPIKGINRFAYTDYGLKRMVENVEKYGPR